MKTKFLSTLAILCSGAGMLNAQTVSNNLSEFDRLSITRSAKIILKTGDSFSISAADDQTLSDVQYSQNGTRLIIKGNSLTPVTITSKNISQIDIAGNGEISSDGTLKSEKLEFNVSGNAQTNLTLDVKSLTYNVSGNATGVLAGKAETVELNVSGRLNITADSLLISKCTASVSGLATFKGDIRDELNTYISGRGSIYYVTRPAVVNTNNSGITKIGDSNKASASDTTKISLGGPKGPKVWFIMSDHDEINFGKDKPRKSDFAWAGLELGWNNYVNADGKMAAPKGYENLDLNDGRSMFFNMNLFEGKIKFANRHLMIGSGLGFSFTNYFFRNENQILISDTNAIVFYQSEQAIVKNKLTAEYLTVPLLLQFNSNKYNKKNFHITAGVVMNWNIGSHVKFKDTAGDKTKIYDDYNLRALRFDTRASIGYGNLNLFASYGLQSLFNSGVQPEITPLNFGITLVGW